MKKTPKKKFGVAVEMRNGILVHFGGSKNVLGGLIDLIAMGLRITKVESPKKK